jgi:hypothetical protein
MFHRSTLASLCLVGLAAMGCSKETTGSSNIKTGGIAALIDVYAEDDTTATVHVELKVGGDSSNTYVDLEGSDKLVATAGDKSKTLSVVDSGIYEADFSGLEPGTEFQVVLDRPDDTTASDNSGVLPDPFDFEEPASDLSRADDDLELVWAPSGTGDDMEVEIDGSCTFPYSHSMSDSGAYTVAAGEIESTGGDKPEACNLTAQMTRTKEGVADTLFDPESHFRLHQVRTAKFSSNP